MKYFALPICIVLSACNSWKQSKNFTYSELKSQEFATTINSDSNYILVDVRTPKEYYNGHMKDAINISYFHSWFTDSIKTLDRNKTIYMYCQTQHRSPLASRKMKKLGFKKIIDLKGGFIKWGKNSLPIVK